jgi:glycosyltransferase involved in cell wall biosynthesis
MNNDIQAISGPAYTIGIPVYERVFGFDEALQSAINVVGCTEIVVVDDNSSHNQFETICASFNDSRIKYYKNATNNGLFGNWNRCVELATGEFVSILCSDDLIKENAYSLFLQAYNKQPDIDVFFGSFCMFTDSLDKISVEKIFPKGPITSTWLLEDLVKYGPNFPVLTITRKTMLLKYPFVAKPHSGNDWLWIYSNASAFKLYAVDEPINFWRRHLNQDASLSKNITMDCWPLMYCNAHNQLKKQNNKFAAKAYRKAIGFILTSIINNGSRDGYWATRINNKSNSNNIFLQTMMEISEKNWLLSALLDSSRNWFFYYNIGRLLRKLEYYPAK